MSKTPGRLAYEAFMASVDPVSINDFDEMNDDYKAAWEKAVLTAATAVMPVQVAVDVLVEACHGAADKAGWWVDPKTGVDVRDNPLCFSNKVALIHSEVSEALEGDRKNKMDDHLPHLPSRDVELADALIRIADTSGGFKLQLGRAVVEKLAYNAKRADHKIANRQAEGGKAY